MWKSIKEQIKKEKLAQLEDFVNETLEDVKALTPVDTGALRTNFSKVKQDGDAFYFTNSQEYAESILLLGRRKIGNRIIGSLQLPDGIIPFIQQKIKDFEND